MSQPVTMHRTERHIAHSEIMNFDFEISIHRPPANPGTPLPVIYTGDANFSMGFAANMNDTLLLGGEIPPRLTVGIGYPVEDDFSFVGQRRTYDFSPTHAPYQVRKMSEGTLIEGEVKTGSAPLFIRFMREELWFWLQSHFSVAEDRSYVGDSMGGLFGTYVLFNHPGFSTTT